VYPGEFTSGVKAALAALIVAVNVVVWQRAQSRHTVTGQSDIGRSAGTPPFDRVEQTLPRS
jgi:hypothetical protein